MKDKYERVGWILGVLLFLGLMGWLVALTSVQESLNRRLKAVEQVIDRDTTSVFRSEIWTPERGRSGVALYYHYRGNPADSNQIIDSIRTIPRNPADTMPAVKP